MTLQLTIRDDASGEEHTCSLPDDDFFLMCTGRSTADVAWQSDGGEAHITIRDRRATRPVVYHWVPKRVEAT